MGYTHYFPQSRDFTSEEWRQIKDGIRKVVAYSVEQGVKLQYEYNDARKVSITDKLIRFNGPDELGHETFYVSKIMTHNSWEDKTQPAFQFCKTARKPYDLAVCLSLLRIKAVAPDAIRLSSDGDWDAEWQASRTAYKELFEEEAPTFG